MGFDGPRKNIRVQKKPFGCWAEKKYKIYKKAKTFFGPYKEMQAGGINQHVGCWAGPYCHQNFLSSCTFANKKTLSQAENETTLT